MTPWLSCWILTASWNQLSHVYVQLRSKHHWWYKSKIVTVSEINRQCDGCDWVQHANHQTTHSTSSRSSYLVQRTVCLEENTSTEQFGDDASDRPDVNGGTVSSRAHQDLRRSVVLSHDLLGHLGRPQVGAADPRQTKITDLSINKISNKQAETKTASGTHYVSVGIGYQWVLSRYQHRYHKHDIHNTDKISQSQSRMILRKTQVNG